MLITSLKNLLVKAKLMAETARNTRICTQSGASKNAGIIATRAPIANQTLTSDTVAASIIPRTTAITIQTKAILISGKKTPPFNILILFYHILFFYTIFFYSKA